jgi:hypothetical protein
MNTTVSTVGVGLPASPATRWRRDRVFYTVLPVAMAVAVFVGFAPTYYLKSTFGTPALRPLYHLHGFLFTCWMLLLIVQPALVAVRRTDVHRRLGVVGGVLAAAMMVMAFLVTIDLGRRGAGPPGVPPLVFLIVPFATLIVFPSLIGAALWWRRKPETHKRLMLIGTLELIPAGIARWAVFAPYGPLAYFGLSDLFVLAMLAYDRTTRGRFHPATIWGGLFLVASQVLRIVVSGTETWQSFARWLIS